MTDLQATAAFIQQQYPEPISLCAVLGSGLGALADQLKNPVHIPYTDIPNFPQSSVEGHAGTLVLGQYQPGKHAAFMQGRFHYYEGFAMNEVVYPVRVLKQLGASTLLVTNAAGGVNPSFKAGDLMLITDHLNMMGTNPLIGPNDNTLGTRFPDMTDVYSASLRENTLKKAADLNIALQQGVYCAMTGPTYETPAEVRMVHTLGADAVGMSTVPEVIAAKHMGMQVLGISCITNAAAGLVEGHQLNHEEVLESAQAAQEIFLTLLGGVLGDL